jgi:hypothetical protein
VFAFVLISTIGCPVGFRLARIPAPSGLSNSGGTQMHGTKLIEPETPGWVDPGSVVMI